MSVPGSWIRSLSLDVLGPDTRLALRMLVKRPLLSVVGGLGLAVAIAIATGFFTFLAFYYSDVPVAGGDRIVTVDYIDRGDGRDNPSTLFDYQVWQEQLGPMEVLAACRTDERQVETPIGGFGSTAVAELTASAFRVFGIAPLLGRPLLESDEAGGAPKVIVIGYREWRERFGADPSVVGRVVSVDGAPHTVVGVMPEDFRFPLNHGFWTPLATATLLAPGEGLPVQVFGRLKPGLDPTSAEAEAAIIGTRLAGEHPEIYGKLRPVVVPYIRHLLDLRHSPTWMVWLFQLFAGFVLVLVAVNVAVLFYARTARRRAEITIRTALGASRGRIVTQLFLEALALSTVAAALGLIVAQVGFDRLTLVKDFQEMIPFWLLGGLPLETILYAFALAAIVAVVVGVLPALQATGRQLQSTLREIGGGTGLRMGKTWTALICVQVAVAGAVLPAVVGIAWNSTPPPTPTFPASEVLRFELERPSAALSATAPEYARLQDELRRRVEALPEVAAVTFATSGTSVRFELENAPASGQPSLSLRMSRQVDPDYFSVIGVPLLAGRPFEPSDTASSTTTVIVNRSFVEEYFADRNPLGERIRELRTRSGEVIATGPWLEIVGVVEDLERPARGGPGYPEVYHATAPGTQPLEFSARTSGVPATAVAPQVRAIATEIAPRLVLNAVPMNQRYEVDPNGPRILLLIVGLVTLSVLLLSAAGISAMMSFAVSQRQREVAIRTALGATRGQVIRSIFARSTRQLGIGLVIGAAGAWAIDRLSGEEMLRGEAVPIVLVVAAIMLVSGLLATLGPARRALRIEPMEALREE
ncbi:MAG TPA: ABC transporter permease [Gemmatimonadaceae bacterium]